MCSPLASKTLATRERRRSGTGLPAGVVTIQTSRRGRVTARNEATAHSAQPGISVSRGHGS